MHEQVCRAHREATHALIPALAALPPEFRGLVIRILQEDIDLLSLAAIHSRAGAAEPVDAVSTASTRQGTEGLRVVVAHLIRTKVELLGPIVFPES